MWGDVDLVENVLRVRNSKHERMRLIALSKTAAETLWQHRRGSAFRRAKASRLRQPEDQLEAQPCVVREGTPHGVEDGGSMSTCVRSTTSGVN